jgi:hypothetical protein
MVVWYLHGYEEQFKLIEVIQKDTKQEAASDEEADDVAAEDLANKKRSRVPNSTSPSLLASSQSSSTTACSPLPPQIQVDDIAIRFPSDEEVAEPRNSRFIQYDDPYYKMKVYGMVYASEGFATRSDGRSKADIQFLKSALVTLSKILPRSYRYVESAEEDKRRLGLIAQELYDVVPEATEKDEDGTFAVDYGAMTALCIAGVNELQQHVHALQQELDAMSKSFSALKLGPTGIAAQLTLLCTTLSFVLSALG